MTSGQTKGIKQTAFVYVPDTFDAASMKRQKTHHYERYENGVDYVFEAIDPGGAKGYMTGQGRGIQSGDILTLRQNNQLISYQVETIDYYASPDDMWVALLVKIQVSKE